MFHQNLWCVPHPPDKFFSLKSALRAILLVVVFFNLDKMFFLFKKILQPAAGNFKLIA